VTAQRSFFVQYVPQYSALQRECIFILAFFIETAVVAKALNSRLANNKLANLQRNFFQISVA
jgi:hypothetical protein